jgi:hypothetical protein
MIKTLLVLTALGVMISGCFMVPMAFIGPAASGFSTASLAQSAVTTGASYMVKKNTGKTITEHAFDTINPDILKQSYIPKEKENFTTLIFLKSKPIK